MILLSLLLFLLTYCNNHNVLSYQFGGKNGNTNGLPPVNRKAIFGLWKLTPRTAAAPAMKEFTVYPKRPNYNQDIWLMLKEDGSFQQYHHQQTEEEQEQDVDKSWSRFQRKESLHKELVRGTWDFVDGKLILAADRQQDDGTDTRKKKEKEKQQRQKKVQDTLLVGQVVANYETSLGDHPVLQTPEEQNQETNVTSAKEQQPPTSKTTTTTTKTSTAAAAVDAHLFVPRGSVEVGRFFYPKSHPSFFEQPMFQPVRRGAFSLRQVLGTLNTQQKEEEDEIIEKYQRSDFYNKTFLLTSHPIGAQNRPKGNVRWSIKYNKYVTDPPSNKKAAKAAEEEAKRPVPIRVMQVQFHGNNTFSTVAGLGESIVLRGKFDIVGQEKDQLWMQVWRFGFGRSVSGSVYSEGKYLTQDDAKTYWGTIGPEQTNDDDAAVDDEARDDNANEPTAVASDATDPNNEDKPQQRLEVKGSVMVGWGLEPLPVGRFIMREVTEEEDMLLDEEEEDEDDSDEEPSDDVSLGSSTEATLLNDIGDDGIDWSGDDDNAFQ